MSAVLMGVLALDSTMNTSSAEAAEAQFIDNCANRKPAEQSILVATRRRVRTDSKKSTTMVFADEKPTKAPLEPIANVSEYEPDLAEPVTVATRPNLAAPPQANSRPKKSPARPTRAAGVDHSTKPPLNQALSFNGITPGISKRHEVIREWGDPRSESTTAAAFVYRFDKLKSVRVEFDDNLVDTIAITLEKPLSSGQLTQRLGLQTIRPTVLTDKAGATIALVYPERGVVMRLARAAQTADDTDYSDLRVMKVLVQPIKTEYFLLRAKNHRHSNLTLYTQDLEKALTQNRTSGRAHWLLSDIYLTTGQAVKAERHAAESVEIEPRKHLYRLQHAKCLRQLARYEVAVEQTRKVLEAPGIEPLVRALALHEMGLLASLGSTEVAQRAVSLHTKSIEIADKLTTDNDFEVQQVANQLLVEAHLAMAVEIARGGWEQKTTIVPQWIERASALSEEMIAADPSNLPLRLQVAVSALAAAASFDQPIDPLLWVEEAEETARQLKENTSDKLLRNQYNWQLGLVYFQAAQIEHRRSEPQSAERLGELADRKLSLLALARDEFPDTGYLLGRLYFQIGAVHAVHYEDHVTACRWYDQATDLLLDPVPVTTMSAPQHHGDALVSMGVSYWQIEQRDRAVELTLAGVELIEEAVEGGLLKRIALEVPYNNLSAMYEAQGETKPAARYSNLASSLTETTVSSKPSQKRRR